MLATLACAKKLEAAGFTKTQAETLAEASKEFFTENLATKTDIATLKTDIVTVQRDIEQVRAELKRDIEQVRADLKGDSEQVRAELKTKMAELKVDLLKWIIGLPLAQTGIIAGVIIVILRTLMP